MDISAIKPEFKADNVQIDGNTLYLALGTKVVYGETVFEANLSYRKVIIDFIQMVNPKLNSGELHHMPIRVYRNGLDSTLQIMKDNREGKNSGGVKLVATLK